ncbi:EutN/CcmL family microcompartment protein [Gimesia aquarii]|uniref:Ethanolamine utilization protein EutN/carboxysome n=1 Tax=Gimesia aquarii TaxID=2527964 RepID=A0A517WS69_9PLAN|nr:EutN/CcmL family microcompartment protein [Gimesia aquarii]QDU08096.1 Ethanolamine utilization protein EutN/carboxysome [Gimesia aquarii]
MKIAEVIGKVTLSRKHPSLDGARWLIATPLKTDELNSNKKKKTEPFVIYDELGASSGSQIAVSEGAEAAAPFHPDVKPIDAYVSAILDQIEVY